MLFFSIQCPFKPLFDRNMQQFKWCVAGGPAEGEGPPKCTPLRLLPCAGLRGFFIDMYICIRHVFLAANATFFGKRRKWLYARWAYAAKLPLANLG